jgi:antitoxin component of MazEF toxin-antitoxin module
MEKVKQVISAGGLQIPLPIMERYGLHPGASVVLELDELGIHIAPALPEKQDIENLALQYLLAKLGDAVTIRVEKKDTCWQVDVFGADLSQLLGTLFYYFAGELLVNQSTSLEAMRQTAILAFQNK